MMTYELVLHNTVTLKLQESQLPGSEQLQQFQVVYETEEDKFLLLYALLKLSLIRGKALLFVNTLERGYQLQLFLEQFSIPSCMLNGELPLRSRCHIISQFNQGFFDCVIATDAKILGPPVKGKWRGRGTKGDNASDPESERSCLGKIEALLSGEGKAPILLPYQFQMEGIDSFRYHCRDAMRSVTKQAIREARLKEIKEELLHSEKIKTYFEDNPRDLQLLRHDLPLHPVVVKPHLGNVPDYLVPAALRGLIQPRKKWRKLPSSRKTKKGKTQNLLRDFKNRGKKPKPTAKPS
ncbi:Probable ATP-dependent RNA helicase DDX56 [Lemmus lemmus]